MMAMKIKTDPTTYPKRQSFAAEATLRPRGFLLLIINTKRRRQWR